MDKMPNVSLDLKDPNVVAEKDAQEIQTQDVMVRDTFDSLKLYFIVNIFLNRHQRVYFYVTN